MKQNRYIKKIVNLFFHHSYSDEMVRRVLHRMAVPALDVDRDEAMKQQWDGLKADALSDDELDEAFKRLDSDLQVGDERTGVARFETGLKSRRLFILRKVAAVAIPIMFVGSLFLTYHVTKEYLGREMKEVTYVQHYTQPGETEQICLPDGTKVWLNAGSMLVYPSSFGLAKRTVFLSGEAFFDVHKDQEHPFELQTNHLDFQVLGTSFNVSSYPDNSQVVATLETGKLQVRVKEGTEVFCLLPDQQLVYTPSTQEAVKQEASAADFSKWRQGHIMFTDSSFADVLNTLERMYGVHFYCDTPRYQHQKLRLYLNKGESLKNTLEVIRLLLPDFTYAIVDKAVYIK